MEKVALKAQIRDKAGKGVARGLRREKQVPGAGAEVRDPRGSLSVSRDCRVAF